MKPLLKVETYTSGSLPHEQVITNNMLNSTKTWQEELENLMVRVDGDLDAVDGLVGITNTQIRIHKINEFIADLRKYDEEELIKKLPKEYKRPVFADGTNGDEWYNGANFSNNKSKQLIKDYYAK